MKGGDIALGLATVRFLNLEKGCQLSCKKFFFIILFFLGDVSAFDFKREARIKLIYIYFKTRKKHYAFF